MIFGFTYREIEILSVLWLISNAVSMMPTPKDSDTWFYKKSFDYLHGVFGMVGRILRGKFGGE